MNSNVPGALPCPFCGSAPRKRLGYSGLVWIECVDRDCHMIVEAFDNTEDEALARWNKRFPITQESEQPDESI